MCLVTSKILVGSKDKGDGLVLLVLSCIFILYFHLFSFLIETVFHFLWFLRHLFGLRGRFLTHKCIIEIKIKTKIKQI